MSDPVATPAPVVPAAPPEPAVVNEEGAHEGSAAPKPPADATPAEKRKFKVKVDKEELEVDEDELIAGYQSRRASQKAWQGAAEQKRQIVALFEGIKRDPIPNLKKLLEHPSVGHDLRKIATDLLTQELERENLTPEQRELSDARKELAQVRAEREERERAQQESETAELRRENAERIQTEILEALKPSGLPFNRHSVKRVTYYLKEGLKRGYRLSAEDVLPLVRKDYEEEQRALFSSLDGEALEKMLTPEIAEKLSKRRIEKLKTGQAAAAAATSPTGEPEAPRAPREKKSDKPETFADIAKRISRGK